MKHIVTIITGTFILLAAFRCFSNAYAQTAPSESNIEKEQTVVETPRKTTRPRMDFVKMVDFYLRDSEKLVFGKLVLEDRNKITVERLDESRIIVSTYSKREIDARTLRTKTYPKPNTTWSLLTTFPERPGTSGTTRTISYRQFAAGRKPNNP